MAPLVGNLPVGEAAVAPFLTPAHQVPVVPAVPVELLFILGEV